jgi:hypothetical protein
MCDRRRMAAQLPAHHAEVGQCGGLGDAVAEQPGSVLGLGVHGEGVGRVPTVVEVRVQRAGQPHGVFRPAVAGRMQADCDQRRAFRVEPEQRGLGVVEPWAGRGPWRQGRPAVPFCRVQRGHGRGCAVQIMIEETVQGTLAVRRPVLVMGAVRRIRTHEIMHRVPGGDRLLDQVLRGEMAQVRRSGVRIGVEQRRAGMVVEVRAGVRGHPPQQGLPRRAGGGVRATSARRGSSLIRWPRDTRPTVRANARAPPGRHRRAGVCGR